MQQALELGSHTPKRVQVLLRGAIHKGVPLWNSSRQDECTAIYLSLCRRLAGVDQRLGYAAEQAQHEHPNTGGWTLRHAMDEVLGDIDSGEPLQPSDDLKRHRPTTFLNIGSGSGYFMCLVSSIAGTDSLVHAVECSGDNVLFAEGAVKSALCDIEHGVYKIFHKNIFDLDVAHSRRYLHRQEQCGSYGHANSMQNAHCRYNRIYIGAGISRSQITPLLSLLEDSGICVAPVDSKMVRFTRAQDGSLSEEVLFGCKFKELVSPPSGSESWTLPAPL